MMGFALLNPSYGVDHRDRKIAISIWHSSDRRCTGGTPGAHKGLQPRGEIPLLIRCRCSKTSQPTL
jgi:hypothetical protein